MREIHEMIYEKADYDEAKGMGLDEVAELLDEIDDRWLGRCRYCGQDDYEGDESDYKKYKLHIALSKAINFIQHRDR